MSVILIATLFYKELILQGEIRCWSLLGLKGLKINQLTRYPSVGHIAEDTVAGYSINLKRINYKTYESQVSDLSGLKSSLCLALKLQIE